ncbi:hypothetical protein, partial [Propionivibrio sp.]|uniref:hypothetical protein n=1 Tax=Propionivibrio sp. TaxID=2212460 RepID=UPI00260838A8
MSTNNGNVFILDINALKISKSGSGMAVLSTKETLTPLVSVQDIPVNQGQEPQFISAAGIRTNADGVQQLRLLLTDGKNVNAGLATVTVNLTTRGDLSQTPAVFRQIRMSGVIAGDTRINDPYKLNIQRAQSPVLATQNGVEYALVADYFFDLNEPDETTSDGFFRSAPQMGGKVGIVKDPFGKAEYLGATTPIIGGNISRLHITEDGKSLMADLRYWPTIGDAPPPSSGLLTWNLADLIAIAELNSINKQNSKQPNPIDRVNGRQVVAPEKQDLGVPGNLSSGWVADIASSHDSVDLNTAITLGSKSNLNAVDFRLKDDASEVLLTISTFPPGHGLFEGEVENFARVFTRRLTAADIGSFAAGWKTYHIPDAVYLTAGQHYYWGVEAISVTGQKSRESGTLVSAPILDETNNHFAGVTIITHDSKAAILTAPDPESELKEEIKLARAIATQGGGEIFIYMPETMKWQYLGDPSTPEKPKFKYVHEALGHPLVLISNWILDSSVVDSGFSEAAADGLFAALIKLDNDTGNSLFNSPLHFIGFGRGASVNSEVTQRMGKYYPEVTNIQFTTLDPHDFKQEYLNVVASELLGDVSLLATMVGINPAFKIPALLVNTAVTLGGGALNILGFGKINYGDYLDPVINRWSNIGFFDNYYQQLSKSIVYNGAGLGRLTFTVNGREIVSDPTKNRVGADVNINLNNMAGFNNSDIVWSPAWFQVGTNDQHYRVLGWYYGTVDLSADRFTERSLLQRPQYIFRSPLDRRRTYEDLLSRLNIGSLIFDTLIATSRPSFATGNAWYRAGEIKVTAEGSSAASDAVDQRSQEGTGIGWGYSYLGGRGTKLPVMPLAGASVEDSGASTQRGSTKEAIPSVFNGDFQSARDPIYGRIISFQTGYEIPGWSFQGGSGGWAQGVSNQGFTFDWNMIAADIPDIPRAVIDEAQILFNSFAWNFINTVKVHFSSNIQNTEKLLKVFKTLFKHLDYLKLNIKVQKLLRPEFKYFWDTVVKKFAVDLGTTIFSDVLKGIQSNYWNFSGALKSGDVLTHNWQYFPTDKTSLLVDVTAPVLSFNPDQTPEDSFTETNTVDQSISLSIDGILLVDFMDAEGKVIATESVKTPKAAGLTLRNREVKIPTSLLGKVGQFSFRVVDVVALKKARGELTATILPWSVQVDNVRLVSNAGPNPPRIDTLRLEMPIIAEGKSATISGTISHATTADQTHTVFVDWGNNRDYSEYTLAPGVTDFSYSNLYRDDTPSFTQDYFDVIVTVFDSQENFVRGTSRQIVNNAAPTLDAQFASPSIADKTEAKLQLNIRDPGLDDSFTVTVDWGDGTSNDYSLTTDDRNPVFSHLYDVYAKDKSIKTDSISYTVNIHVADKDGGWSNVNAVIEIVNRTPVIDIRYAIIDGQFAPDATVADPNPDTDVSLHWEIFDPTGVLVAESFNGIAPTTPMLLEGIYSARLTVTNGDGGQAEATITSRTPPLASDSPGTTMLRAILMSPGASFFEGGTLVLDGDALGGALGSSYVEVNWGDGDVETIGLNDDATPGLATFSRTHTIRNTLLSGVALQRMTVSARLMKRSADSPDIEQSGWLRTILVQNVPPELSNFTATPTATAGEFEFGVSVQDPGLGDTFTYVWNFGNGIVETTTNP